MLGLLVTIKAVNCKEIVEAGSIFQVRPTAYMYYYKLVNCSDMSFLGNSALLFHFRPQDKTGLTLLS